MASDITTLLERLLGELLGPVGIAESRWLREIEAEARLGFFTKGELAVLREACDE